MRELRPRQRLLPEWNMPSDPVKAVFWFFYWLLRVLVRYFYVLIAVGAVFEAIMNGIIGFAGILLVGALLWAGLAALLLLVNVATDVSRAVSDVGRAARGFPPRGNSSLFHSTERKRDEPGVVEGTITDLEEERKRRRQE